MMTKEQVIEALHEGIATVEFTKVDGTIRMMDCTLDASIIPQTKDVEESVPEGSNVKERKQPTTSLAVWDIEKHGWRSFRWESLFRLNGQEVSTAGEAGA